MEKDADQRPMDTNLAEDCQASMENDADQGPMGTNLEEDGQDSATSAATSRVESEENPAAESTTVQAAYGAAVARPRRQRIRRHVLPQFQLMSRANPIRLFPRHQYSISTGTAAETTVNSTNIIPADSQRPDTSTTAADANSPLRDATTEEKSDALITSGGVDSGDDASQVVGGDHRRLLSTSSRISSNGSLGTVQEGKEYVPNEENPGSLRENIEELERPSSVPEIPPDWETLNVSSPGAPRRRSFSYDDDDSLISMYINLACTRTPRYEEESE